MAGPSIEDLTRYVGPPLPGSFATLLGTSNAQQIQGAIAAYRRRFEESGIFENRLYPGIETPYRTWGSGGTDDMANLFHKLFGLLNRDLTGKTSERGMTHPYFGPMVYFGHHDPTKGYWEAELAHPTVPKKFSVTLRGTPAGPLASEQAFCQTILQDLDALFLKCRAAFEHEFPEWSDEPFPSEWRTGFVLDGLSIPERGEPAGLWTVCYFAESAGHYFTAEFEAGRVARVVVDG